MNLKQRREWAAALAACRPRLKLDGLDRALEPFDGAEQASWQVGLAAGGSARLSFRLAGGGGFEAWARAAAEALAARIPSRPAPPAPAPWFELVWDAERGRAVSRRACWAQGRAAADTAGARWRAGAFSPRAFGDAALEAAMAEFAALHRPSALVLDGTGRWELPLSSAPAWPHFASCDLAARFAPECGHLALLLRDLAVERLAFDGEEVLAFCA